MSGFERQQRFRQRQQEAGQTRFELWLDATSAATLEHWVAERSEPTRKARLTAVVATALQALTTPARAGSHNEKKAEVVGFTDYSGARPDVGRGSNSQGDMGLYDKNSQRENDLSNRPQPERLAEADAAAPAVDRGERTAGILGGGGVEPSLSPPVDAQPQLDTVTGNAQADTATLETRVFELHNRGLTLAEIARALALEGFAGPTGKPYHATSIGRIKERALQRRRSK